MSDSVIPGIDDVRRTDGGGDRVRSNGGRYGRRDGRRCGRRFDTVSHAAGARHFADTGVALPDALLIRMPAFAQAVATADVRRPGAVCPHWPRALRVDDGIRRHLPPDERWMYLKMAGVRPDCQGKGLGGALMRHALAECDRDGSLAYLESSNPRNVPLYQHLGFELLGTIQAGSSPELFPMLRKPQRRT